MEGLSSSSFTFDAEYDIEAKNDLMMEMQDLKCKNDSLQKTNDQLQKTLINIKNQLHDAVEAKNSIESLADQLKDVKSKLAQETEEKKKFEKQLQQQTEQISIREESHKVQITKIKHECDDLQMLIEKYNSKLNQYRSNNQKLKDEIKEKDEEIKNITELLQSCHQKKKQAVSKNKELTKNLQLQETAVASLTSDQQKLETVITQLQQEIESLKLQLNTSQALNESNDRVITGLNEQLKSRISTASLFEKTLTNQKNEIETLSSQRENLISLLQRMHQAFTELESECSIIKNERDLLKQKLQKSPERSIKSMDFNSLKIENITIPFTGKLGENCKKAINSEHFQPQQRLQAVFSEVVKEFAEKDNQIKQLSEQIKNGEEKNKKSEDRSKMLMEFISSLTKELKNIALFEENINRASDCKDDSALLQLIANKCSEVDPLVNEYRNSSPEFIPSIFFSSENPTQRSQIIQKILNPDNDTFALFSTQFILNVIIRKQLNQALTTLNNQEKVISIASEIGLESANEIPDYVRKLTLENNNWMQKKKQLISAVKVAQRALQAQQKSASESQTEISKLRFENETLSNDVNVLKARVQVLTNEAQMASAEQKQRETSIRNEIQSEFDNAEAIRVSELESSLKQSQAEKRRLEDTLDKLRRSMEDDKAAHNKQVRRIEAQCARTVDEYKQKMSEIEAAAEAKKSKFRKQLSRLQSEQNERVEALSKQFDAAKADLAAQVDDIKEKSNASMQASQRLLSNLKEAEAKIASLRSENHTLREKSRSMETQVAQSADRFAKERQQLQAQLAAQSLLSDARAQDRVLAARAEGEAVRQKLLDVVAESIGTLYGVDSAALDEQSLEVLVSQARKDLEKLKFFQTSAQVLL